MGEPAVFKNATRGKKLALTILAVVLLTAGATALLWEFVLSPRAAFRRFVMHPIPRSVRNIKADHWQLFTRSERMYQGVDGHDYVLRFDISRDDLSRIIEARGLKIEPWERVECREGMIRGGGTFIKLYRGPNDPTEEEDPLYPVRPRPSWYDLDSWEDSPGNCAAVKDEHRHGCTDTVFLLYNDQLGSAFFVRDETSGF
jgi:hypothetical protein